ncbi:MAG: M23 family metallopeptidase [Candidatus Woesearchaeota archaeon]|nr:MAG: M23 family metallopeptidase [Candidatus Woesearchaeota archaeon]
MKTKNEYSCPIELNNTVKIKYNESPAHVGRLKNAVDFIVPIGTPIKASLDGIVVDVNQDSDTGGPDKKYDKYGNFIELRHQNEEYSIYEHIRKDGALVKKGQEVKEGQIIGYSGETGWIAHLGPHLHFEVHKYLKDLKNYKTLEIRWKTPIGSFQGIEDK